jgi:dimethylhistidine N-methyltransferase
MIAGSTVDLGVGLAADVRHYLTQTPRQLPSRALYDTLGSLLFDAICELPWYPLTRAERRLIRAHAGDMLRHASSPSRIVELGPGNGSKLDLLLRAAEGPEVGRIDLVDVSATALCDATRRLQHNRTTRIVTHEARYEDGLRAAAQSTRGHERTMVLFLGSNIGNFDPAGASGFLGSIRSSIGSPDSLLIGVDLVKPEHQLLLAYDDPLGLTAAFNKNLLVHLNQALGASFDVTAFDHRAVWNAGASRVEMHLVSRNRQRVDVPAAGLSFELGRGEHIWTESSYKYTTPRFDMLLRSAGFEPTVHWRDDDGQFLLVLAR